MNPLIEKTPRSFAIGQAIQPVRDLGRFVKWPEYVRLQRQRAILKQRLKVPPSINQFSKTLDKNTASTLFKLFDKYKPESQQERKARLFAAAERIDKGEKADFKTHFGKKPIHVKYGINHITALIENKKPLLVVIADDVDPIELVVWLPALCRKMGVPYCIVKSKARLGAVVGKKTATALALCDVRSEDKLEFSALVSAVKLNFNEKFDEVKKQWGGGIMGAKSRQRTLIKEKIAAREVATRG